MFKIDPSHRYTMIIERTVAISILCTTLAQNSCNDSDTIRLVNVDGSASVYKGRVELCIDNHWREACGDEWRQLEADIACTQLLGCGSKFVSPPPPQPIPRSKSN